MRVDWVAACSTLLLLLVGCTPFEGTNSGEEFAKVTLEEAFPGSRVMGEGEAEIDLGEDASIVVPYVIQEGYAVAGEDMILGPADAFLDRSAGLRNSSQRWDTCTIPYSIASSATTTSIADFRSAIAHWEQNTGIRFVENASQANRIQLVDGAGCSSFVGKVGGAQALTLNSACGRGAAIHEIGHALGFFHEQARADRDQHVVVHLDRVQAGREHNFRTYVQRGQQGVDLGSYDVGSIMHYGSWAFATGTCSRTNTSGCTITHTDGSYLVENQRDGLSSGDLAGVAALYPQCGTPDDHGNTVDTATVLVGARTSQGTLTSGDVDVFAIQAPAGHSVVVYTTGTTDTVGDLLRDGAQIATDDTSGDGPNFRLGFIASDSAHHVRVEGWSPTSTGAYTLHVEVTAPTNTGDDHGDHLSQATVITGSTSVGGTLTPGDADYFLLDVAEGSTVTIGTSGTTDTVGDHLIDGIQVATDDTSGEGPNFELTFVATSASHAVRVEGWRATTQGAYTLNVDVEPPVSTDDHGDTEATATPIGLATAGITAFGATLDAGDTDVFRVQVGAAGALSAFTEGSTDTYGTLYDANGTILDQNDDTTGLQFAVTADVQPGTYFLFVRGYATSTTGSYQLNLTLE